MKVRLKFLTSIKDKYPIGDGDHGQIKPDQYLEEGIPYIRVQNLGFNNEINYEGMVYISEKVNLLNAKSVLKPGDILVAKTGATIGKAGIVPDTMPVANTTSSVGKITVDPNKALNKFIYYWISSDVLQTKMWEIAGLKSAQPGFNIEDIKEFEIDVPSLDKQVAISNYLDAKCSAIDGALKKEETTIEELKQLKTSLISKCVFQGLSEEVCDSNSFWMGKINKSFVIYKLKYVCKVVEGLVDPKDEKYSKMPHIGPGNIEKYTGRLLNYNLVEDEELISGKYLFSETDIIYGKINPQLGKATYPRFKGLCSADSYALRPFEKKIMPEYLLYFLLTDQFIKRSTMVSLRSAMPKINREDLMGIEIPLPTLKEQKVIINYLDAKCSKIDDLIKLKEERTKLLKAFKKSLIYECITSKKEVPYAS